MLGTAGYMSPEQARGRRGDRRTDIWAMGCILFEKDPKKRMRDAADAILDIDEALHGPHLKAEPAAGAPSLTFVPGSPLIWTGAAR